MAVKPDLKWVRSNMHHLFAFGFGFGLLKPGPGTWGTLLALVLWFPLNTLITNDFAMAIFLLVAFFYGVYCCQKTSDNLGVKDYSGIVWDEVVAFWLVLFVISYSFDTPLWYFVAFVLFRAFDIFKPWPIRLVDRSLKNGFGVMLDDIVAAFYTLFVFALIVRLVKLFV